VRHDPKEKVSECRRAVAWYFKRRATWQIVAYAEAWKEYKNVIVWRRDKGLTVLASFLVTAVICLFVAGCRDEPVDYYNRGCNYHAEGQHEWAISDCTKALGMYPDYAESCINRGSAYKARGDYDLAISDFATAIEKKPGFAQAYKTRGNAYEARGMHD
jgi:tetratricopeptide (TPR) repeat protein